MCLLSLIGCGRKIVVEFCFNHNNVSSGLQKAWHKLLNWYIYQYDDKDDVPLSVLFPSDSFFNRKLEETQLLLTALAPGCILASKEITAWNADILNENETDTGTDQEDDNVTEASEFVPYNDAICAVKTLIKWNEYNAQSPDKHFLQLFELQSDIVKWHLHKKLRQNKAIDYYTATNNK